MVKLERLKDEQIRELVRDEFRVKNPLYLERIADIAQGNPRLAVMAAKVAVEANTLESIANVSVLYDEYYRAIRQDLQGMGDPRLLKAAAIIAFFRVVDRSNVEQMGIINQAFGMAPNEFWSYTRQLHELEAVDIYENEVVKVSDQVLATYFFYLAAFREHHIDLTLMFERLFPSFRQRFLEALNPIFVAFGAEATKAIRPHVDAAWDLLLQQDNNDILYFMDLFWFIRPTETLVRVAEMIRRMPGEPSLVTGLEFKKSQGGVPAPSALSILGRFADGDDTSVSTALQSLVDYFIRRPSEVGLVLRVLEESFGITHHSHLSGFAVQQMVVDVLSERAKGGEEELVARLFMTYAQSLLHTHFDRTGPIRGHAFTILKFDVLPTDELKELRRRTWRYVLGYYKNERLRDQVLQFIEEHCRSGLYVASPDLVSSDAQEIVPFFLRELNPSEYRHCVVVHEYLGFLGPMDVPLNHELAARFTNETFELATLLLDDWVKHRAGDWQEFERQKRERLNEFGKRLRKDDINPIVERCREIRAHLSDSNREAYVFENGLRQVLLAMAEQNPKLFVSTVVEHLQQGNVLGLTPWALVENLIRIAGPSEAYRLLNENEYPHKARWLSEYFISLPPEAATQERLGQMYDLYDKTQANQLAYDLDFLLKFTSIDPDIILKVTRLLVTKADAEQAARERLTGVVSSHTKIGRSAAALFREDVSLLKQIYFAATGATQGIADYDGQVFDALLSMDAGFIAEWVAWMFGRKEWLTHYDDDRDYTFLWRREDYKEILERLLDAIVREGSKHYGAGSYPRVFFTLRGGGHDHEALRARQDAFLGELINSRSDNQALMSIVFDLIGEFNPEGRLPLIATFLEHNQDVEAFKRLCLGQGSGVWRGSAVPMWQKQVDFLESLLPLCASVPLLRHRQVIEQRIRDIRNEIDVEKKQDFLRE